jgi:hypothetical protein
MRLRHAFVSLLLVSMLVALACGGDGGASDATATPAATATPEGTIVTSDDGKLTLSIPNGAMPEGTEVTATSVPLAQLPLELQQLRGARDGYLLGPDGLEFSQPVTATLALDRSELPGEPPNGSSAFGLVSFNETAGREVLPVQTTRTSLTDGTVTVSAEINHLSYVGLTQGSLQVALQIVGPQIPANSTFTADAGAKVVDGSVARLTEPAGIFVASGQVSVDPVDEAFIGPDNEDQLNTQQGFSNPGTYHCGDPGPGTYGLQAKTIAVVPGDGGTEIRTELNVELEIDVECVAGGGGPTNTPAPAGPTNTPPSGGGGEVTVKQTAGCEHTQPGVKSEFRKKGKVTDASGNPIAGARVVERATGPGLIDPNDNTRTVQSADKSATTDANGGFSIVWEIRSGGPYTGTVQQVVLASGQAATLSSSSTLSVSYTVVQVCATPSPP